MRAVAGIEGDPQNNMYRHAQTQKRKETDTVSGPREELNDRARDDVWVGGCDVVRATLDGDELCVRDERLHTRGIAVRHDAVVRPLNCRHVQSVRAAGTEIEGVAYPDEEDLAASLTRVPSESGKLWCEAA